MPFAPGTRLGSYEVTGTLGAGGMGEVHCARDSRLGRLVALKTLPPAFVGDAERLARFRREAQILASLNHPHIAQIYGLDEAEGHLFLVLELVDGESLDRRLARGPVPVEEALAIARQVAEAVEAAHEKGIVHRDLKPANIAFTKDGRVKVLDFGLAKAIAASDESADPTNSQAITARAVTGHGLILGTPAYMAPEQAQGRPVDKRADIWAFGAVLFEMLSGDRPFQGSSSADVLAAVLHHEPDWSRIPARLQSVVRRCLAKDPAQRLRDIGDFRFIEEPVVVPAPRSAAWRPWVLATTAFVMALGLWRWMGSSPADRSDHALTRPNVDLGPDALRTPTLESAISPDGRRVAFVSRMPDGTLMLATRALDQASATRLDGTENAAAPFFSPDGQSVGFFADGKLKRVPATGGAVVTIANATANFGASWGDDQQIYFTSGTISPLMRVPAGGGTPDVLMQAPGTRLGERGDATHRWPQALPGGRVVLFTSHKIITGFDDAAIDAVVVATGERKVVLKGGYFGRYVAVGPHAGYLLYVREGVLFAIAFDPESLTVRGTATPVVDDIAGDSDSGAGQFALTGNGTLLYRSGRGPARRWPILWMDGTGRTAPLIKDPGAYYTPRLSPDGSRMALTVDRGDRGREIEVYDWQRGTLVPLTHTGEVNLFPVWSPDGQYIVFESSSPRGYGLGVVRSDGSGTMQRIAENSSLMIPYSFAPDGALLYSARGLFVARFDTSDPEHPKLGPSTPIEAQAGAGSPALSPDGRWIAYRSTESGRSEVYVRAFRRNSAKWQVSTDGDGVAGLVWDPRERRVYYVSRDNRIMAVDYQEQGNTFLASPPRVWAAAPIGTTAFPRNFTIAADGKRFAVLPPRTASGEDGSVHVTFVMNFLDELRRRVEATAK